MLHPEAVLDAELTTKLRETLDHGVIAAVHPEGLPDSREWPH